MIFVIYGPSPVLDKTVAPAPVTVHCAVGVLCVPSSSGNLNCFSALQKWLDVAHITLFAPPPSRNTEPRHILSTNVEQAPNTPKYGMFVSLNPKSLDIHWFNKSPAKQ